jgi:hypothetical protein
MPTFREINGSDSGFGGRAQLTKKTWISVAASVTAGGVQAGGQITMKLSRRALIAASAMRLQPRRAPYWR